MTDPLPPSLRNDGHVVTLVEGESAARPELGVRHPEQAAQRAKILRQWGQGLPSPRAQANVSIEEPLSRRSQTVLSYEVTPELRAILNGGGAGPMATSRKQRRDQAAADIQPAAGCKGDGPVEALARKR